MKEGLLCIKLSIILIGVSPHTLCSRLLALRPQLRQWRIWAQMKNGKMVTTSLMMKATCTTKKVSVQEKEGRKAFPYFFKFRCAHLYFLRDEESRYLALFSFSVSMINCAILYNI